MELICDFSYDTKPKPDVYIYVDFMRIVIINPRCILMGAMLIFESLSFMFTIGVVYVAKYKSE